MKIAFIAEIEPKISLFDTEKRLRHINLSTLNPSRVNMYCDQSSKDKFYVQIICENTALSEQYIFDDHLDAVNLFNDVVRYMRTEKSKRATLFSTRRRVEFDYPVPESTEVYRK